jgi:hypothetical protein
MRRGEVWTLCDDRYATEARLREARHCAHPGQPLVTKSAAEVDATADD